MLPLLPPPITAPAMHTQGGLKLPLPQTHARAAALSTLPLPASAPGVLMPPPNLSGSVARAKQMQPCAATAPALPAPAPRRKSARVDGDVSQGFVQVLLPAADDAQARVLFISRGVHFLSPTSMVPCDGVLNIHASPTAPHTAAAYRWRG